MTIDWDVNNANVSDGESTDKNDDDNDGDNNDGVGETEGEPGAAAEELHIC